MFENKQKPLLPRKEFFRRLLRNLLIACGLILFALLIGMIGYHGFAHLSWIDSIYNASMILAGMGPVDPLNSDGAKLFASAYAIFSGVAFLSIVGLILAPVVHRFMHKFHLADEEEEENEERNEA